MAPTDLITLPEESVFLVENAFGLDFTPLVKMILVMFLVVYTALVAGVTIKIYKRCCLGRNLGRNHWANAPYITISDTAYRAAYRGNSVRNAPVYHFHQSCHFHHFDGHTTDEQYLFAPCAHCQGLVLQADWAPPPGRLRARRS